MPNEVAKQVTPEQAIEIARDWRAAGKLRRAFELCQKILEVDANHPRLWNLMGLLNRDLGNVDQAVTCYKYAISLKADAATYFSLAVALYEAKQVDSAIAAYKDALALQYDLPEAHNNLGMILLSRQQIDEAVESFRKAAGFRPNYPTAFSNLGEALKAAADLTGARISYSHALTLAPNDPAIHSNLIYAMQFDSEADQPTIRRELNKWNTIHGKPLKGEIVPHTNEKTPARRLRIGYVSPYFHSHVLSRIFLPVLARHDHEQFEIFLYSDTATPDHITEAVKKHADTWRPIFGMDDASVANLIREDRIDILVDLSVHMANRLRVFARKPAPIQFTWIGYPGSTGLDSVDYRFTDPYLDPPGLNDAFYSEQSIRLKHSFWSYDPLGVDLKVNGLPALRKQYITFGCLNNFCKINIKALQLWARVMQKVRNSRLLLLCPPGNSRQWVQQELAKGGITPDRIQFEDKRPHRSYLELHHQIDIALDTYPYNGHTTSLDALWMGVPVVSLYGQSAVSRAGFSQLSNLALASLATDSQDKFVAMAVELATNLAALNEMRSSLRQAMEKSPLTDAKQLTQNVESEYRLAWIRWCEAAATASQ